MIRAVERNRSALSGVAALRTSIAFGACVLLGLLLSVLSFPLFARFGLLGFIILVAIPAVAIVGLLAIPELIRGLASVKRSFGWQQWLWLLLFLSAMDFRVRDYHDALAQPLDSWAMLKIAPEMLVAGILVSRLAARKSSLKYLFSGLPGMLMLFCVVALASASWSVAPSWTVYKSLEYLLDVAVLAAILETVQSVEDYVVVLNWTWILYALETSVAWVGAVVSPANAWDEDGRLRALYPLVGANIIGTTGAILSLVAIARLVSPSRKNDRAWYWAVCLFGIITMLVAQTRNAIGGFLLGLPLLLLFANRKWIFAAVISCIPAVLWTAPSGGTVWTYLRRGQVDEQLQSFTGRLDWWQYAWTQLSQHPVTGLGAFAGGKFGVLAKLGVADATYLHSDWLEIVVGTSFWGLLAFAAAVLGSWWFLAKAFRSRSYTVLERQLAVECIGVLGMLTVHSFFNNELSQHPPLAFLAVLGCAELLRRKARAPAAGNAGFDRLRPAFET